MRPLEAAANEGPRSSPLRRGFASSWVHEITILLLVIGSAVMRFVCLTCKPFWFDESFSAEVARLNWPNFLHLLWWREANMSLYYVLLRMWMGLVPVHRQSEFFIRSLSVLIAVATVPAVYWLAEMLYDRRVALMATALLTFNAFHVRYAQEARGYALFVLLATLSSGFLLAEVRQPSRRDRIGYVLCSVLAVYVHFYALLLLAAHWLALRWLEDSKREAVSAHMRRAWITIGIAVLPLLVFVAKTGAGPIKWIRRPGLRDLLEFGEHLAGSFSWALAAIFAVAAIAAIAPLGKRLWGRHSTWEAWRCQFLLTWLFFPIALTVVLSFARPVFLARYMIFCLPALVILVAAGLAGIRQSWLLAVVLGGVLLLGWQGVSFVHGHDFDSERDASGAATNFILDHCRPGDGVIFHIAETRVPYEFFRSIRAGENSASPAFTEQLGPEILFPHHGAGLDYRDFTGKPTAEFVQNATANRGRMWVMLMNNGTAENPDATTIMLTRVLGGAFPKMTAWELSKVQVRVYSRE
jgi:mannosyltransferase